MARRFTQVAILAGAVACAADPPQVPVAETTAPDRPPMSGDSLMRVLGCGSCHVGLPLPASPASALSVYDEADADRVLARLRPPASAHPDFHLDDREAVVLARYLGTDPARSSHASLRAIAREAAAFTDEDGARLFAALNCAGCHAGADATPVRNGPVLAMEGSRVQGEWLRAFLRAPRAVRPFGVRPGDGGRMPRFALTDAEIDSIATVLLRAGSALPTFTPEPLSDHSRQRTATLITERYSCLGCHVLEGAGGRIGPDLSGAGQRLRPEYVRAMLETPAHFAPGTIMPPTVAPAQALDRIAAFLIERDETPSSSVERAGYLSPLDHMTLPPDANAVSDTYATRCGACHGSGDGNGYNARYLRVQPVDHTNAAMMGVKSDDRLFDAIAAGAFFLDGSPEMPAFANLPPDDVIALVAYIRTLCSCREPAWARAETGAAR